MARGWESTAVDDRIGAAEAKDAAQAKPLLTVNEREQRARREGLLLARARIVTTLAAARHGRHRAVLETALAHVDAELAACGPLDSLT